MISDIDFERLTLDVCQVARQAGDYIRNEHANFSVDKVERKHAHDYVSYVDKGSEQMIVKALRELLPPGRIHHRRGHYQGRCRG